MKSWRKFLLLFLTAASFSFAEENDDEIDFNPFTDFISSIQNTRLLTIDVDIWDEDEAQDQAWALREASLERKIREKLKEHGLVENAYHELKELPGYLEYQSFYDEQFDNSAYLNISIYKKNQKIFVEMNCWKNSIEQQIKETANQRIEKTIEQQTPLYARTFSYIIGEEEEEEEEDDWWWIMINDGVLFRVNEFLDNFCRLNPGPYGWVHPM